MTMHEDALLRASSRGGWDRRTLLKTFGAGAVAMAGIPLLSACTGGSAPASGGAKTATFGSGSSDEVPKAAYKAVTDAFQKKSGIAVTTNVVAHNDFQNKINTYLQGSPDDSFTWFAGYRMRYYAGKGLLAPIDDVWEKVGGNYSDALKKASTGDDGKMYLIPNYNYPWGFFYRKSLWTEKGYTVPTTFDELKALATKMKADGLIPIEFADKDGWPAMGTFDYLNMRLNGYQFHMDLTAHRESWDQKKVSDVFDTWKALLPFQNPNALGMTWQDVGEVPRGQEIRHVPARLLPHPAVHGQGNRRRHRLLPVPRGRGGRPGRHRGTHRRPAALQEGRPEPGRPGLPGLRRHPGRTGCVRLGRLVQHRHRQGRRYLQVHSAEQEAGRGHQRRQEHQPVLRPRCPARHGQQRDDPGAAVASSRTATSM